MDRTTKILLGLIALGLFANAGRDYVRPALAQDLITNILQSIESDLSRIEKGKCHNSTIC